MVIIPDFFSFMSRAVSRVRRVHQICIVMTFSLDTIIPILSITRILFTTLLKSPSRSRFSRAQVAAGNWALIM